MPPFAVIRISPTKNKALNIKFHFRLRNSKSNIAANTVPMATTIKNGESSGNTAP